MQKGSTAIEVARWVALGALFLLPLTPLIVANSFYFPFITGKAFYLRILIEILVAAWVVLALLDKAYRPRFSWIGAAVLAFVLWMFIADAFAPNAAKAFWSNFERMEGWVMLIHLAGFFFASSAVLRVEKRWRSWFFASVMVASIISVYALLQLAGRLDIHQGSTRIDATLGNSAYLAIYLLFTAFVAGWLALTEKRMWLKWLLAAFAALEVCLIFFTETRGAIVGVTLALFLTALLTALTAGKQARRYAIGGLALMVVAVGSFYLARNSAFVQDNHVLERVASISLTQLETRLTIWPMALRGAMERPLTGWGQEGFNYVFNKYYDPSLYRQEPWFDRAHNAFLDWLVAGGIPAFLLYLSLFGTALLLLWRRSELSRPERILLTAAFVGYAVHNLFVFDNLYSYIYFFALLAFIDSQVARPLAFFERARELSPLAGVTYALPMAAVAAFGIVWMVNVPGMKVANGLIGALTPSAEGRAANLARFSDLAAHPAFVGQEIREQLVAFAADTVQDPSAPDAVKQQAVMLAVTEMQKQVERYPEDARGYLQLSYAFRTGGALTEALAAVGGALSLSPKKEQFWIEAGGLAWQQDDTKAAREYFQRAYALGAAFPELAVYAAAGEIAAGDVAAAHEILVQAYGTKEIDSDVLVIAYYQAKQWDELIALMTRRTEKEGAGPEAWFALASAYYAAGDKTQAISAVRTAAKLFPEIAGNAEAAIQEIQAAK